jgi:hypothetical protein
MSEELVVKCALCGAESALAGKEELAKRYRDRGETPVAIMKVGCEVCKKTPIDMSRADLKGLATRLAHKLLGDARIADKVLAASLGDASEALAKSVTALDDIIAFLREKHPDHTAPLAIARLGAMLGAFAVLNSTVTREEFSEMTRNVRTLLDKTSIASMIAVKHGFCNVTEKATIEIEDEPSAD